MIVLWPILAAIFLGKPFFIVLESIPWPGGRSLWNVFRICLSSSLVVLRCPFFRPLCFFTVLNVLAAKDMACSVGRFFFLPCAFFQSMVLISFSFVGRWPSGGLRKAQHMALLASSICAVDIPNKKNQSMITVKQKKTPASNCKIPGQSCEEENQSQQRSCSSSCKQLCPSVLSLDSLSQNGYALAPSFSYRLAK